jgi:hypothetical protein
MPKNPDLPRPPNLELSKASMLQQLVVLDQSLISKGRVLEMETQLRRRIGGHIASVPRESSQFRKFNTSPFVLMFYANQRGYHRVSEIERDILPAKLFSSMETSAGIMIQDVVLPVYGWELVASRMQSTSSIIDGRKLDLDILRVATIKSGPRCLNDEMSKDLAADIVENAKNWADEAKVDHVDFTYGVLYGTPKQSNKKDWHILRNIVEMKGSRDIIEAPRQQWSCSFRIRGIRVDVGIRIGTQWWAHLGGPLTFLELMCALIRACVPPCPISPGVAQYIISDLGEIVSLQNVPEDYNVGLLQRSQLEWLFFLASHYCDNLQP